MGSKNSLGTLASTGLGVDEGGEGWVEYSVKARLAWCCLGVSGVWAPLVVTVSAILLNVRINDRIQSLNGRRFLTNAAQSF